MAVAKLKTLEELVAIRQDLKKQGKVVVTTNGAYDLLHVGHVRSLQESKARGDVLLVGVNSDSSIKEYKSDKRPIISEQERAEVVAALECVDYVFIFYDKDPIDFVEQLKPNVHTNSSDYGQDCVEREAVENNGGRLHLLEKHGGYSSSEIIEKILDTYRSDKA